MASWFDVGWWTLRCANWRIGLPEPPRDALHGFAHVIGGARIGEANELTAMSRIEIDAGGRRNMRFLQHLLGEFKAVGGELRDVGIKVKRAVSGQELVEAGPRQALDQDLSVHLVPTLDLLHLL